MIYITGAKFEDHCSNTSGDILNSVFYRFSGKIYDVMTTSRRFKCVPQILGSLSIHEAPLGVFGIWDICEKKLPGYGIFEEKVIGIQDIEK